MIRVKKNKNLEDGGRPGISGTMTPQQIQTEAMSVMEKGLSNNV